MERKVLEAVNAIEQKVEVGGRASQLSTQKLAQIMRGLHETDGGLADKIGEMTDLLDNRLTHVEQCMGLVMRAVMGVKHDIDARLEAAVQAMDRPQVDYSKGLKEVKASTTRIVDALQPALMRMADAIDTLKQDALKQDAGQDLQPDLHGIEKAISDYLRADKKIIRDRDGDISGWKVE